MSTCTRCGDTNLNIAGWRFFSGESLCPACVGRAEEVAALDEASRNCDCPDERCERCYEREQKRLAIEREQRGIWEAAERVRLGVRDPKTSVWVIEAARSAFVAGCERMLFSLGRTSAQYHDPQRLNALFAEWWDRAAGLVPVAVPGVLVLEPAVDGSGGDDKRPRHDDQQDGLEDGHTPGVASTDPRSWADGVKDAIKIVEYRQKHYELYRAPGAIQTKPEVFATIDELLIFLKAMLERGEYASRSQCDV